ncbi:MAG: amino acid permease, partial [Streptosporangiaceae bacterium]
MTDITLEPATAAAAIESQKLQRHFGRFDILFFLICAIVGVDTIANVAQGGGQAFTWMMVFAIAFFIPQAMMFSELGSAFPMEGGPYYWTRLAFGHLAGAVNNFLYWITNPVWIGGSLTISCIAAVQLFFNGGRNLPTVAWFIVALAFVWLSIVAAIMSFSVAKWLPTAGAFARFVLLGLFTLSVIIFAVKHGVHGAGGQWLQALIVLPSSAITNFSGFVSAIQDVFTVYGGHISASGAATLSGGG